MSDDSVSKAEVDEAMALLTGQPILAFEPGGTLTVLTESGEYITAETQGWIKFSTAFRDKTLGQLKGPHLAVFICICLHVNTDGKAWPGIETICKETHYEARAVSEAIADMEKIPGLLDVTRQKGKANVYRPAFAAYGNANPKVPSPQATTLPRRKKVPSPREGTTAQKYPPVGRDEVEKPLSRKEEVEKEVGAGAPASNGNGRTVSEVGETVLNPTKAIQAQYEALLGYKLGKDWVKGESTAAKAMADKWTPTQLSAAYAYYKANPFWSDKRLSLAYLLKQMPEYFRNGATHGTTKQATSRDGAGSTGGQGGGSPEGKSEARLWAERLSRGNGG